MSSELEWTSATELAKLIRRGKLSPVELVDALLARIERVNPQVNAYCTVTAEQARARAKEAEAALRAGDDLGLLHGVPYSLKDLTPTKGIRTTMGSKIFEHNVPEADGLLVQRMNAAGAILLGKTNTPEFGCKPLTDNRVFGATRNPWALDRSPGGSSGGASAAVAAGLGPLAQGSDLAASIRQPAAWSGVVGFKPSQGRVPRVPNASGWSGLSVDGPMTRTVGDAALMVAAIAGLDPRDPLSLPSTGEEWESVVAEADAEEPVGPVLRSLRVAWTPDLGGAAPVDPTVARICANAARAFEGLECILEEDSPEIGQIERPFVLLNAGLRQTTLGKYLAEWRDQMDPILVKRLEVAGTSTALDVAQAEVARTAYHQRLCAFFERYDLLLLPTSATPALPVDVQFPIEVGGRELRQPFDMLLPTYAFNFSNFPAISVPAGWTDDGLPVGLQIVGGWQQDALVLRAAAAFEQSRPWADRRPSLG
jgi:Asp-tRNA(Asn)/Glu-tRNA(Gln) amidotransferase A subunit family amidase